MIAGMQGRTNADLHGSHFRSTNTTESARRTDARASRVAQPAGLKAGRKWKIRLAELDREGVAARQAKLFAEDQQENQPEQGTADTIG